MNGTSNSTSKNAIAGLLAGVIAGICLGLVAPLPLGFNWNLGLGTLLGLIFGLTVGGPQVRTAGSGLVWGEAFGVVCWLIGPMTLSPILSGQGLGWSVTTAQNTVPLLLGLVICYGAVLGLAYYCLAWGVDKVISNQSGPSSEPGKRTVPTGQTIVPPLVQALIIGGLGGLLGSWVFLRGIETAAFIPLVAGLMGSNSMVLGTILHYVVGTTIGISFGLLFYRDVLGTGSSLVWGLNYGLLWWAIGPLTLLPGLLRFEVHPDWSLVMAQAVFAPLVGHLLYGAVVGLFYALINRLWRVLFVDSDPLNRSREGAGARGVRGILMGIAAGIVGGLLFTIVMVGIGALPQVASLVGARSAFAGFIVHLIIAVIIGISYGLLFQREAYSYGAGLAWGLVYGLLWWFVGAITLFPMFLRQPVDWSLQTVTMLYPSLIGHLLYGAGLGLFFQFLARRYDDDLSGRPRHGSPDSRLGVPAHVLPRRRTAGTPAAALWAVTLVMGVMLPLLLF